MNSKKQCLFCFLLESSSSLASIFSWSTSLVLQERDVFVSGPSNTARGSPGLYVPVYPMCCRFHCPRTTRIDLNAAVLDQIYGSPKIMCGLWLLCLRFILDRQMHYQLLRITYPPPPPKLSRSVTSIVHGSAHSTLEPYPTGGPTGPAIFSSCYKRVRGKLFLYQAVDK